MSTAAWNSSSMTLKKGPGGSSRPNLSRALSVPWTPEQERSRRPDVDSCDGSARPGHLLSGPTSTTQLRFLPKPLQDAKFLPIGSETRRSEVIEVPLGDRFTLVLRRVLIGSVVGYSRSRSNRVFVYRAGSDMSGSNNCASARRWPTVRT